MILYRRLLYTLMLRLFVPSSSLKLAPLISDFGSHNNHKHTHTDKPLAEILRSPTVDVLGSDHSVHTHSLSALIASTTPSLRSVDAVPADGTLSLSPGLRFPANQVEHGVLRCHYLVSKRSSATL